MPNGKRLPGGYKLYQSLMKARGVKSYLTPKAYGTVGALKAFEAFLPRKPKAVVAKIRARKRGTGVSGLF